MVKQEAVTKYVEQLLTQESFDRRAPLTIGHLSRTLGLNPRTVAKGLDPLVRRNLVRKVKGTGIVPVESNRKHLKDQIGLIVRTSGDVYADLLSEMLLNLAMRNIEPFICDIEGLDRQPDAVHRVEDICSQSPAALIVFGDSYYKRSYLKPCASLRTVFVGWFDGPGEIPGTAVVVDFDAGLAQATQHLADLGHTRIALAGVRISEKHYADTTHRERSPYHQSWRGYARVMDEAGLSPWKQTYWWKRYDGVDAKQELRELMRGADAPSAFVCTSDMGAAEIMKSLLSMGRRVPEDVAIVGFYDTSWAGYAPVSLTSVNIQTAKLAELAVMAALSENGSRTTYKVCPDLVLRESSGGERNPPVGRRRQKAVLPSARLGGAATCS